MVPFYGYPKYEVPYYNRDPIRGHKFDNHHGEESEVTPGGSLDFVIW